jgi:membrane-bound ClpP family serine protease
MTDENLRSQFQVGELGERASSAASALLGKATLATAPDLRHIAVARRLSVAAALAALALVVGGIFAVSVLASGALPWIVGTVLVAAVVGVIVLGLHAGGHGWFVPLPVIVLAGTWALVVSAGNWTSPAAWALAAVAFLSAFVAAALIVPAVAYRHALGPSRSSTLPLGADGITLGPLNPVGLAKVNNETWTAQSVSGPLPAGAPIHVVKVEGLRLLVWSEAGNILGPDALGLANQEKEER